MAISGVNGSNWFLTQGGSSSNGSEKVQKGPSSIWIKYNGETRPRE